MRFDIAVLTCSLAVSFDRVVALRMQVPQSAACQTTLHKQTQSALHFCSASFEYDKPVVVTMTDQGYAYLLDDWGKRMDAMGWRNRVIIALDVVANNSASSVAETCVVPYYDYEPTWKLSRLPVLTGLGKFDVLRHLLQYKFTLVVFSEMDVFWLQNPYPYLAKAMNLQTQPLFELGGMNNVHDKQINIGFLTFRPGQHMSVFMDNITCDWEKCISVDESQGTTVAADQEFFSQKVERQLKPNAWITFDPVAIAKFDWSILWGNVQNKTSVVHFTGHTFREKTSFLEALYAGEEWSSVLR